MPRHHQKPASTGASQRQLRVGVTALISTLISPTAAFAEVCDKLVGESWSRADGAVWLLNPRGFQFLCLLVAVASVLFVTATQTRWIGYVAAGLIAVLAYLTLDDFLAADGVFDAAVREGCRSQITTILDSLVLISAALASVWLAHRQPFVRSEQ